MSTLDPQWQAAVNRWGYLADAQAKKYGLPNGATLLARIGYVETRNSNSLTETSSAGARGPTQFEPATQQTYLKRFHVNAYGSVDEAVHAMALFMKTDGLAGYNPGSSTYINEVLKAPVTVGPGEGPTKGNAPSSNSSSETSPSSTSPSAGSSGMTFLLTVVLVGGGLALGAFGLTRAAGAGAKGKGPA